MDCGGRQGIVRGSNHGESETQKEKGPESLPLLEKLIEKQGVVLSPLKTRLGEERALPGCWGRAHRKDGIRFVSFFSDSKQADKEFLKPSNS